MAYTIHKLCPDNCQRDYFSNYLLATLFLDSQHARPRTIKTKRSAIYVNTKKPENLAVCNLRLSARQPYAHYRKYVLLVPVRQQRQRQARPPGVSGFIPGRRRVQRHRAHGFSSVFAYTYPRRQRCRCSRNRSLSGPVSADFDYGLILAVLLYRHTGNSRLVFHRFQTYFLGQCTGKTYAQRCL